MSKFFNWLYLFSKLSTSLILFVAILFIGYIFGQSYLSQNNKKADFNDIENKISNLTDIVEKNVINLNAISDSIIKNNKSYKEIAEQISKLNNNNNEDLIAIITNLTKDNKNIKSEISNLTSKISNIQNHDKNNIKNDNMGKINDLISLIKIKLKSGEEISNELNILNNYSFANIKKPYLEKINILSNRKFIGFNKLNIVFDQNTSEYLDEYYFKDNKNLFIRYFSYIVSVKPNFEGDIKNETIRLLADAKRKLENQDLKTTVEILNKIEKGDIYFKYLIKEAKHYIEFENTINYLIG